MKIVRYPNKTYKLGNENILGYTEDVCQSIENILRTDRYQYPIYSGNYGVSLTRLIGKDIDYIKSELPREVTEALKWDDRVISVGNFNFEQNNDELLVTFTVYTIGGEEQFQITQTL